MQDLQNIPNPDVNSTETNEDFGSHSDVEQAPDQTDIENPNAGGDDGAGRRNDDVEREDEAIPVPPDRQPAVPIEDPPNVNNPPVGENEDEPERIV